MERFRQDLEERLGDWVSPLPECADHMGVPAVAVCPHCRRPICGDCVHPLPTSLRCHSCRPWLDRLVPAAWVAPLSLVAGILGRRWALHTLAFCIGLGTLLWCCPNLVRPQPPSLPDWLAGSRLQAPFLEQSFRLSTTGRAFLNRGHENQAQAYFARAESACRRHLKEAGDSPLNRQIWLGIGRLQEKQGHIEQAKETFTRLMEDPSVRGVAAYYLGRIAEEHEQDGALDFYQAALEDAKSDSDSLGRLISFYAEDREKNQWPYVVASLTDTVTSADAIRHDIETAIARCQPAEDRTNAVEAVEFLGAE